MAALPLIGIGWARTISVPFLPGEGRQLNLLVLDIDGQEYRDGKPFTGESALFPEGDDPEEPVGVGVASRSAINSTEITDDDIPF